jgi:hypothetical protein
MLAVVWHYWLAVALMGAPITILIVLIVAYLKVVVAPRYPKR